MNTVKETMDKRDLARLVDYYRIRVEAFEKERAEWLDRLEALRMSHEESHRTEWELRRRTDEVLELQNTISESNLILSRERKQIFSLTHELENMKLRSKEDRRRLVQLLQLSEPIEQTIKLYHDRRPEKLEKFANFETNIKNNYLINNDYDQESVALNKSLGVSSGVNTFGKNTNNKYKSTASSKRFNSNSKYKNKSNSTTINNHINVFSPFRILPSDEKQHVVRTVLLPNEETQLCIEEENETLKKQLNEMKSHYETQIFKMEEDRRLREEEMRLRDSNFKERLDEIIRKNQKLDRINYETTKDYMQIKFDSSNNEKKLYEELEMVKLQNEALSVSLQELMNRFNVDKELNRNDYERKTKDITNVMRTQIKTHEENNNIIKEQYKQIQKIYTNRVKELEDKLKNLTTKYKNLENKRSNEIEGYINEIALMRKKIKSFDEYVTKIKNLHTEDFQSAKFDQTDANLKLQEMNQTDNDLINLKGRLKEDYRFRNTNNTGQGVNNQSYRNKSQSQSNFNNSENYSQNNYNNQHNEGSEVAMEDL